MERRVLYENGAHGPTGDRSGNSRNIEYDTENVYICWCKNN